MSFPAALLLIVFAIIFLILTIMAIVHIFHAVRFGGRTHLAIVSSGIFLIGIGVIVLATLAMLVPVDWTQTYDVTVPSFNVGEQIEDGEELLNL